MIIYPFLLLNNYNNKIRKEIKIPLLICQKKFNNIEISFL